VKYKSDFVTNSSSSSFVVMGVHLGDMLKIHDTLKYLKEVKGIEVIFKDDSEEILYEATKGTDLHFSKCGSEDNDDMVIGIKYTYMREDETLGEFKARVKQQLKESLNLEPTSVQHIEAGWYDG